MKAELKEIIEKALVKVAEQEGWSLPGDYKVVVEHARDKKHGDYASNIALMLGKKLKMAPLDLANRLCEALSNAELVDVAKAAPPGFINFTMSSKAKTAIVPEIIKAGETYGSSDMGAKEKVIIEFVSANPTGPLHVGHGRGAAIGATLANILRSQGFDVNTEYYVNDAGRQMDILAVSVWLRYLNLFNVEGEFPQNAYRGEYIIDIAQSLKEKNGELFVRGFDEIFSDLPADSHQGGDKEVYIDAMILRAKSLLGEEDYKRLHRYSLTAILDDIRQDLEEFGVSFDNWFSEQSLFDNGDIEKGIKALEQGDYLYQKEDATWFKSTLFGDEKDRVLRRANGQTTYFASDVAYHWNKYDRGFNRVINIFGADHHGYVARVKAAAKALGFDEKAIDVLLVQFAVLYRGQEKVQMSTRSGEFVTIRTLREEVGKDAARFFYILRKSNQHMDFDLDLAKSQSNDNPVYYVQYAHARICSVFRTLAEKSYEYDEAQGLASLHLLKEAEEEALLLHLQRYQEVLKLSARDKEPHQLAYYLRELANLFHTYYNARQFIIDDEPLRHARLALCSAVKQVLQNGLNLTGVSAPEKM